MPTFLNNRSDIEFTGYDIVEANIDNHRRTFVNTDWKFEVLVISSLWCGLVVVGGGWWVV